MTSPQPAAIAPHLRAAHVGVLMRRHLASSPGRLRHPEGSPLEAVQPGLRRWRTRPDHVDAVLDASTIVPRPCSSTGCPSGAVDDMVHRAWVRARSPLSTTLITVLVMRGFKASKMRAVASRIVVDAVDGAPLRWRGRRWRRACAGRGSVDVAGLNASAMAALSCSGFVMWAIAVCPMAVVFSSVVGRWHDPPAGTGGSEDRVDVAGTERPAMAAFAARFRDVAIAPMAVGALSFVRSPGMIRSRRAIRQPVLGTLDSAGSWSRRR